MFKKNVFWLTLLVISLSAKSLLAQPSTINGTLKVYPSQNLTTPPTNGALKLMVVPGPSATVLQADADVNWVNHDIILNAANPSGGNLNQLVIHRSGNIGIGLATPGFKLHVPGNTQLAVGYTYVDNSIDVDNNYVRSNFGSNVYWDAVNNRWQVGQIGANDFSAMIHTNQDGFAFITAASDGNVPKSLTNSQFMANERLRITANGNVGIGISSPLSGISNKGLHIAHGDHTALLIGNPGYENHGGVIQTSDGRHRVFIGANLYDDPVLSWRNFQQGKGSAGISVLADEGSWGTAISFYTSKNDNQTTERMVINGDGNVGIGTTTPGSFKLAVNGKIWTQEVNVAMTNPGPDYVFEKDYNLLPLSELETYITQNKHLPEVPSAKEMEADGLNLKEMNLILLKKVEELTLHLIEQNRKIENQQKEIEKLKNPSLKKN